MIHVTWMQLKSWSPFIFVLDSSLVEVIQLPDGFNVDPTSLGESRRHLFRCLWAQVKALYKSRNDSSLFWTECASLIKDLIIIHVICSRLAEENRCAWHQRCFSAANGNMMQYVRKYCKEVLMEMALESFETEQIWKIHWWSMICI